MFNCKPAAIFFLFFFLVLFSFLLGFPADDSLLNVPG